MVDDVGVHMGGERVRVEVGFKGMRIDVVGSQLDHGWSIPLEGTVSHECDEHKHSCARS